LHEIGYQVVEVELIENPKLFIPYFLKRNAIKDARGIPQTKACVTFLFNSIIWLKKLTPERPW